MRAERLRQGNMMSSLCPTPSTSLGNFWCSINLLKPCYGNLQSRTPVVLCALRGEPAAYQRNVGTEESEAPAPQFSRRAALAVLAGVSGDFGIFRDRNEIYYANAVTEAKQTNLTVEQVKGIIENDIREGQYYVTGNLTPSIYNDNCKFTDPTTVVTGVNKYVAAVKLLFDPELSKQELLSIDVTGPRTIEVNWRLGGYLKFPWKPHIMPYEGSTRYTLGDDGLVVSHDETWSISLLTALLELFTPSWGPH